MTADDGPTVAVVDDNRTVADTYASFLVDEYDVRTAYGGREALDVIDTAVDVVLLDRRMPDLTGGDVLERLEQRALDCRVVMLTAVDPTPDVVDMPFDAYVVKPVQRGDVVSMVEEMLDRAAYDDDFRRFLSLASKQATLKREVDGAELASSEEFERIEARLAELRGRLGVATEDLEGILDGSTPDIATPDGGQDSVTE